MMFIEALQIKDPAIPNILANIITMYPNIHGTQPLLIITFMNDLYALTTISPVITVAKKGQYPNLGEVACTQSCMTAEQAKRSKKADTEIETLAALESLS